MTSYAEDLILPRHNSLGWLIAVLGKQLAEDLDQRLKTMGLNIGVWPTLFALWEEEGLTQTELAERCMTAHYTTTRTLDTLEKMALVERRPHPTSRRALQIYLTQQGKELRHSVLQQAIACNKQYLDRLSQKEAQTLIQLLNKAAGTR
ncbi:MULTISPECIES: MarR family winged helix-turn-helix transcriptional regulator [unclassified Oceanobacter]|uniref:MarR family winged helix-turn-helix transcriptional regulator n=1 Tax=unclassified Oceanobacter TaxID=2620260 RepID=UPI0026E13FB4|nr:MULTISPECIES: MarR family transcriptional regulator [unclassified Oceanobacter]MDO6682692.1 MarR family transcriptional regulator [Oceanobacter sp. 5_MG-2023]MDP2549315.1 MarR family transcriptional regulator [Oceanobacter sp. 4_MG-2023]